MMPSILRPIFTVVEPNGGGLLTLAEAKTALGIDSGDTSRDTDINRLIAKISAAIFRACKIRSDGVAPPTLLSEEVRDIFRLSQTDFPARHPLQLSRRRVTEITVTEDGAELDPATYDLDRAAGHLCRINGSDDFTEWYGSKIVVDYVAGFETVPDDLKLAAEMWMRTLWRDVYQTPSTIADPFVKVDDIPGVRRIERWVSEMKATTSSASLMPPEVESILCDGGYVEIWIA
jgi:hypothetical protein